MVAGVASGVENVDIGDACGAHMDIPDNMPKILKRGRVGVNESVTSEASSRRGFRAGTSANARGKTRLARDAES